MMMMKSGHFYEGGDFLDERARNISPSGKALAKAMDLWA